MDSSPTDSSPDPSTRAERAGLGTANAAAWVLVVSFVSLVLSVAFPAMTDASRGDVAAALMFMLGAAAFLLGTALTLIASPHPGRAVLGGLVLLTGVVLLFGFVPSIAALGVVLLGVAVEIGSLPGD